MKPMLDEFRFKKMWQHLGGIVDAAALFAELNVAYSEPQRHYHNASHIVDCLRQLDTARGEAESPDEIEVALWFHDAIYDPQAKENEARSAAWAVEAMEAAGIAPNAIERVAEMILATRHDVEPQTRDGELMLDIDLSILGREPEEFAVYERAIREEYSWVPIEQYHSARTAILERFFARPAIYRTAKFRMQFEFQARRNLEQSIAMLRGEAE
jgi:predicted metal-dependent HD superfamily phosphohydrolase